MQNFFVNRGYSFTVLSETFDFLPVHISEGNLTYNRHSNLFNLAAILKKKKKNNYKLMVHKNSLIPPQVLYGTDIE